MLLLLLACDQGRPGAYADCVVETTAISERTDDASYRSIDTYDADARHVSQWQEGLDGDAWGETTYVYDGPCRAEVRYVTEADGEAVEAVAATRCDEHGHPERTEWTGEMVRPDGTVGDVSGVRVYDNAHDTTGRLVRVETSDPGDPASARVSEYEWGTFCEDPVVTTWTGGDGMRVESTLVCAADGRKLYGGATGFDEAGARLGRSEWWREYDALGRVVTYAVDDDADGFDDQALDYTWVDTSSPGPTAAVARTGETVTMRWAWSYDCP